METPSICEKCGKEYTKIRWNQKHCRDCAPQVWRDQSKTRADRYKAEHRCVQCGKQDERTLSGHTRCEICAEKDRAAQLARSARIKQSRPPKPPKPVKEPRPVRVLPKDAPKTDEERRQAVLDSRCVICGRPIQQSIYNRMYCSVECRSMGRKINCALKYRPEYRFECSNCGKLVIVEAGSIDKRTKFCSEQCEKQFWKHRDKDRKRMPTRQNFHNAAAYFAYERRTNEEWSGS